MKNSPFQVFRVHSFLSSLHCQYMSCLLREQSVLGNSWYNNNKIYADWSFQGLQNLLISHSEQCHLVRSTGMLKATAWVGSLGRFVKDAWSSNCVLHCWRAWQTQQPSQEHLGFLVLVLSNLFSTREWASHAQVSFLATPNFLSQQDQVPHHFKTEIVFRNGEQVWVGWNTSAPWSLPFIMGVTTYSILWSVSLASQKWLYIFFLTPLSESGLLISLL